MQAIGVVGSNTRFPPATRMLGNFKVYPAERLLPSHEEIARRRGAAQKPQSNVPHTSASRAMSTTKGGNHDIHHS